MNTMMSNKLIFLVVLSFSWNLFAQAQDFGYEKNLAAYSNYLSKEYGIDWKVPERFTDLEKYFVPWKVREDSQKYIGNAYGPMFLSNNKDCMVMYPMEPHYISEKDAEIAKKTIKINRALGDTVYEGPIDSIKRNLARGQISGEIETALGLYYGLGVYSSDTAAAQFDFNDYVTIIAGKKPREMFNADSIFVYDLQNADSVYFLDSSLEKMRKEKYPYCTGVFIHKNDRATMDIKFFFTEEGKKKKNEYIKRLSKHIWYDDNFKHE